MKTIAWILLTNNNTTRLGEISVASVVTDQRFIATDIEPADAKLSILPAVQSDDYGFGSIGKDAKAFKTPEVKDARITTRKYTHVAVVLLPSFGGTSRWLSGDSADDSQAPRGASLALFPVGSDGVDLAAGATVVGLVACEVIALRCTDQITKESYTLGYVVPGTETPNFVAAVLSRRNAIKRQQRELENVKPTEVESYSFYFVTDHEDLVKEVRAHKLAAKVVERPDGEVVCYFDTQENYERARELEIEGRNNRLEAVRSR